ncbi:MAG: hypothetical protein HFH41_13340 [Lachnospiraceae bacterium]|nr:hypothetical protein [Lachnospiraceae bacterium]MCI8772199.1 hypothetical protein [Lachnospiraceae bacterium]
MNRIEKAVYDLLKSNPTLKGKVRDLYQSLFDLLPDRENYFQNELKVQEGFYYGFHDLSPINGNLMLANKLKISLHMPQKGENLGVGYWNLSDNKFTEIGETLTWNYHKGCRLQWLGEGSDSMIFNDLVNGTAGSRIFSITNNSFRELEYQIDTVSRDGKFATSFSHERLEKYMPGYGYAYGDQPFLEEKKPSQTGLFLIDIKNNSRKLIISLETLASIKPEKSMEHAKHFVTHTEFSPDGTKIAFLHRWTFDDPNQRFSRLITCSLDGNDICLSPTSGMVSHYVWSKRHGILAYCQINDVDGHYIFDNYKMEKYKHVAKALNSDGHQSYIEGTDYFVTDTYPDKRRYAKIYLVNIKTDEIKLLVDVKSPKKFQTRDPRFNIACDLHPRVSPCGNILCFDSVHTGKRSLCTMQLGDKQ